MPHEEFKTVENTSESESVLQKSTTPDTPQEVPKTLNEIIRDEDKMSMKDQILIEKFGQQSMLEPLEPSFIQSHLQSYTENSGVIRYIDKQGNDWITRASETKRQALDNAGFKRTGDLFVPFGDTSEPAGPERKAQWLEMEMNTWRERYGEALKNGDEEGKRRAEATIDTLSQRKEELKNRF